MGLFDKFFGEFIDIVEWLDPSHNTLIYRFERYQNELKNGAKLIVRESQVAVFIEQGKIADVFSPGTYTLTTENLPVLSTLRGWKHGFNSPFKAEVYFVSTKQFTDLKWGTKSPITLRDPEFGPCRLRAFGNYCFRISDPCLFIKEIAGTDGQFTTDVISHQLRNLIITFFSDALGEAKIPVLDLAANYHELGDVIRSPLDQQCQRYGLTLTSFLVENISLPPEVEQALDKRTSMGIIGDLGKFTQFQAAQSMEAAAANPAGGASEGIGLGVGMAMANQMASHMANQGQGGTGQSQQNINPQAVTPPPLPATEQFHVGLDGKTVGPYDIPQLTELIRQGKVGEATLLWQPGMSGWQPAREIEAIQSILQQTPPPLPEQ
ncbi:SPFH domain-containing protein [Motilimonas eburnea]|uniref:SPFH domain-containing protein n=1 Tax=Motilimonas eburnea TaxID=1737488 RepID=UPI001E5084D8|nr:SPFH domain-containing protein [Motilimonas eburnea]MCE2573172.1 SPFH domain-containing protein [Motilimonas eburnea]